MAGQTVRKKEFETLEALNVRLKGAYEGTITEEGLLVSDNRVLFNRHFVRREAREIAEKLFAQRNGVSEYYSQEAARAKLAAVRDEAVHEGELLGHIEAAPALRVKAERIAGIRYRTKSKGPWRYVWVDAHRLRLMAELFKAPLQFYCAAWDQAVVLKRGTRTVGCIMPASPCELDVRVKR